MIRVGVTGGIGSGKTTVCKIFECLGIPVFYADQEAHQIMQADKLVSESIRKLLGNNAFTPEGNLDREAVGARVFSEPHLLDRLNDIVHPAVIRAGEKWFAGLKGYPYAIKEAALIFESGSSASLDQIITVVAPEPLRIRRIQQRDKKSIEEIRGRIVAQWTDEDKEKKSDYIIRNDEVELLIPQVWELHFQLNRLAEGQPI